MKPNRRTFWIVWDVIGLVVVCSCFIWGFHIIYLVNDKIASGVLLMILGSHRWSHISDRLGRRLEGKE